MRLSPVFRRLVTSASLAVGLAAALGLAAAPAHGIANGTPVADGLYPFSAKLTMTNIPRPDGSLANSACSGALIAPQWIVTAGHCFHDVNGNRVSGPTPYPTTATVGRTDLTGTGGHVVDIVEVRQVPRIDAALGRLATPVTDVVPLALSTARPRVGTILRVTGWGATDSVNPVPVTRLQTGQVRITGVTASTVLVVGYAPAPDTSACLYDSGAPYFVERAGAGPALVSVESDGPPCPHAQQEITARIDRVAGWILDQIG